MLNQMFTFFCVLCQRNLENYKVFVGIFYCVINKLFFYLQIIILEVQSLICVIFTQYWYAQFPPSGFFLRSEFPWPHRYNVYAFQLALYWQLRAPNCNRCLIRHKEYCITIHLPGMFAMLIWIKRWTLVL